MQPVGSGEVPCAQTTGANRKSILGDLTDVVLHEPHADRRGRVEKCGMQNDPAHAAPRPGTEFSVDSPLAGQVADAAEWLALHGNAEVFQLSDGVWHQPFTAGFIYGCTAPFDDNHLKARPPAVQRGGQSGRAAASDKQVDHVRLASAAFSTLIRVLSSAAFSTENNSAVIHAVCTKGSATPSATTAT